MVFNTPYGFEGVQCMYSGVCNDGYVQAFVYKLVDGRYMDCTNTVYIYDGKDTWTDTNGVEWNQEVIQFCQFCQNQKTGC